MTNLVELHVPLTKRKARVDKMSPWFDSECLYVKRKCRQLERRYLRNKSLENFHHLRRSIINRNILYNDKEKLFWNSSIVKDKGNSKKIWQHVGNLMGKKNVKSRASILQANDLDSYFKNKINNLHLSSNANNLYKINLNNLSEITLNTFKLIEFDEIKTIIIKSNNKSSSLDIVPTWIFKKCFHVIMPFLHLFINNSLRLGIFPNNLKTAIVTPITKKQHLDIDNALNYRPISNIPFLAKIIERIVFNQIYNYIQQNNFLPFKQSGFRKFHSAETCLISLNSQILQLIDEGRLCLLASLDIASAFDTIDHYILLTKLENYYGFRNCVLSWFSSYLSNRTQIISFQGNYSNKSFITSGVPQGTILGPILFNMYTSELEMLILSTGLNVNMYADDTQIFGGCLDNNYIELANHISNCVKLVENWMYDNRLKLNLSKTEYIWFGTKSKIDKIDQNIIFPFTSVAHVKILGVIFDQNLTFNNHVNSTIKSCICAIKKLNSIKKFLNKETLVCIIHAWVSSKLDYCNSLLVKTSQANFNKFQSMFNICARLILEKKRYESVRREIVVDLHWLPIEYRVIFRVICFVRNALLGRSPPYLQVLCRSVDLFRDAPQLRSSHTSTLYVPRSRSAKYGDRSFAVSAPLYWNRLPEDLRNLQLDEDTFKSKLKEHLFRQALLKL